MHHAPQILARPSGSNGHSQWSVKRVEDPLSHDSGASSHYRKAPWRQFFSRNPPKISLFVPLGRANERRQIEGIKF